MNVYDIKLSKGFQFTLQAESRRKHNLKPGQKIQVIDLDKEIILRPKRKGSLKNLVGKFKAGKTVGKDMTVVHGAAESYKDANWQMRHMYEPTFTW